MVAGKALSLFTICVLTGCGNSIQTQPDKVEKFSMNLERSGCYGNCPVYTLNVETNGKILFEGKGHTKITGKAEDILAKAKIDELVTEINQADFFSFKDDYSDSENCPSIATDMPTVTLTIQINENRKTINHYLGCIDEKTLPTNFSEGIFPQQLYKLENKIDDIAGTDRWIGDRK